MTSNDEDIDPLDAFMASLCPDESSTSVKTTSDALSDDDSSFRDRKRILDDDLGLSKRKKLVVDDESSEESSDGEEDLLWARTRMRKKELTKVDHDKIKYPAFTKSFYHEPRELARMSKTEVSAIREKLECIRIHGKKCPAPVVKWPQLGISDNLLSLIERLNFEKPTPIQSQAIPAVMSGKDVIGIAKTGSGKCFGVGTELLAFSRSNDIIRSRVEYLQIGDRLVGDDGSERTITSLSRGRDRLYSIDPELNSPSESFVCNADHILVLIGLSNPLVSDLNGISSFSVSWLSKRRDNGIPFLKKRFFRSLEKSQAFSQHCSGKHFLFEMSVEAYLGLDRPIRDRLFMYTPSSISVPKKLQKFRFQDVSKENRGFFGWMIGIWLRALNNLQTFENVCHHHKKSCLPSLQQIHLAERFGFEVSLSSEDSTVSFRVGKLTTKRLLSYFDMKSSYHSETLSSRIIFLLLSQETAFRLAIVAGMIDSGFETDSSSSIESLKISSFFKEKKKKSLIDAFRLVCNVSGLALVENTICGPCLPIVCSIVKHPFSKLRRRKVESLTLVQPWSHLWSFNVRQVSQEGDYFGFTVSGRNRRFLLRNGEITHNTLAFVLPMLRHIMAQTPPAGEEGPIAMIIAPTRELVTQTGKECKKFASVVKRKVACVYGGAGIKEQIAELKKSPDIVVCTPGRMIDLLCANGGRVTNCTRVTMVILDEADRMFDMGFGPQLLKILELIRPDRQTVMFSATFPRQVERVARDLLKHDPVEITVGGKSVVSNTIIQTVLIFGSEEEKFPSLLRILGEWCPRTRVLVFVDTQEDCDHLFGELVKVGHSVLSLHGGKDQADRDSTISSFRNRPSTVLIATSVAARGLDVKDLAVVINFDAPNHLEDYVHRVGRCGRAGSEGHAFTFILRNEEKFATVLVKALKDAKREVPDDLADLASRGESLMKEGKITGLSSGFSGKGFRFDENESNELEEKKRIERLVSGISVSEAGEELGIDVTKVAKRLMFREARKEEGVEKISSSLSSSNSTVAGGTTGASIESLDDSTQRVALMFAKQVAEMKGIEAGGKQVYSQEIAVNDFPVSARRKLIMKETVGAIEENTGAAVTARGVYVAPGRAPPSGERKLFLLVQSSTERSVSKAVSEIRRILFEALAEAPGEKIAYSKYSVV